MSILFAMRGFNRVIIAPSAPSGITPTVHYKLMESAGATVADDDRNVQNGTYVNSPDLGLPAMVSGGGGMGVKPALLQHLLIPHNAAFAGTGGYTFSFVFQRSKTLAADGDREGLFSKPNTGGANGLSIEIIRTAGAGLVRAYTVNDASVVRWIGNSTTGLGTSLIVGTAYRCTLVGGPAGARLYINASELGSNDVLDGLDGNTTDAALGGFLSSGLEIPFNGCFGDFRFYNFALTSEQVTALPSPQNTIWLRDIANINIIEGTGKTIDLSPFAHPESGITAVAGDNDSSSPTVVTHGVPSGTNLTLNTTDISVNTTASITAQVTNGTLTSNEATIGITVQATVDGGGGEPGSEPFLPSLAEWLTSDEATGSPTKFVSNQNRGNGSGSSAANAQEVQAALNGASAGQTFVAVCQTPGTIEHWNYASGIAFPNGASNNRITLKAREGDGVVISAGQTYAAARTTNNGFWTQSGLSSDDINKDIWRSAATFSGGEQALMGWWIEFDHPHQLLRYSSLANLRVAYGQEDSFTNYAGPGVHKGSDGRVYIRMQKPHAVKYSRNNKWSESLWYGYPEAVTGGQIDYPKSQDPNDYEIYLTAMPASAFTFGNGWAKIGPGINSMGFRFVAERNATGVWIDRGTHYTWQLVVQGGATDALVTNYYLNRVRASDGAKLHVSRGEWKFGGPLEGIRSVAFQMVNHDCLRGLYLKDCTICDYHELFTGAKNISFFAQVRMKNCTFKHIFDDGFQARHSMSRCEIGNCFFYNSDWGGMGEAEADGNDPDPGEWYVHHNIFDWRSERNQIWRSEPHSQDCWTGHSPDGNSPRKIYNNLALFGPDRQNGDTIGFEHCATNGSDAQANNDLTGAANTHQVFNNIIILQFLEGTKRYTPNLSGANYSIAGDRLRHDFIGVHKIRYSAVETNELFDYNLWWRPSGMSEDSPFYFARGNSTTRTGYASLTAWRDSAEFDHSKLSGARRAAYTPGVEGNSVQIAPGSQPPLLTVSGWPEQRLTGYRPAPVSSITTASSGSLNGQNWWSTPPSWGTEHFDWSGLAPNAYKGPLDPNGSTMPVGVQNP